MQILLIHLKQLNSALLAWMQNNNIAKATNKLQKNDEFHTVH